MAGASPATLVKGCALEILFALAAGESVNAPPRPHPTIKPISASAPTVASLATFRLRPLKANRPLKKLESLLGPDELSNLIILSSAFSARDEVNARRLLQALIVESRPVKAARTFALAERDCERFIGSFLANLPIRSSSFSGRTTL
jgi:hypothetical protein